jgi:hypothetical protein
MFYPVGIIWAPVPRLKGTLRFRAAHLPAISGQPPVSGCIRTLSLVTKFIEVFRSRTLSLDTELVEVSKCVEVPPV